MQGGRELVPGRAVVEHGIAVVSTGRADGTVRAPVAYAAARPGPERDAWAHEVAHPGHGRGW